MKHGEFNPNEIKVYKIGKTMEDAKNGVDVFYSADSAEAQLRRAIEVKEGVMWYYQDHLNHLEKELNNGADNSTVQSIKDYKQLINEYKVQVDHFKACKVYELTYGFISGQEVE